MKKKLISLVLLCAMLTGCSGEVQSGSEKPVSGQSTAEAEQQSAVGGLVYYVTDHGTTALSEISSFTAELDEIGYTWKADSLSSVPAAPDTVLVLNTPTEDITPEDLDALDSLFDAGGHMLLLMPASEEPVRFKYLERALEEFCIQLDYDILSETAAERAMEGDPSCLRMEPIGAPTGMPSADEAMNRPPYMRNVRSFHFFVNGEDYDAIKHDAMIETAVSAVGTPCGGVEEDPETFEGEPLSVMLYARNDQRLNASIVAVGSSDFLLDEKYSAPESVTIRTWVMSAILWMAWYYNN